jgi:hypothetical protein
MLGEFYPNGEYCPKCGSHSVPEMGEFTGCLICGWVPDDGFVFNSSGVYSGASVSAAPFRIHRPPTRRQLAAGFNDAATAVSQLSANCNYLKSEVEKLTERVEKDLPLQSAMATAVLRRGFWGRLRWIVRGV